MTPAARLRLFYFFYYGAVGANLPFLPAYLRGLGFTGAEIGTVHMVGPAVAAPAALAWAIAADRLRSAARTLRVAATCAFLAMAFLPLARTPLALAVVLLGNALFASAAVPLVDSVTMEWVHRERVHTYARIRLFGSVGFIVVALSLGWALDLRGGRPADLIVPIAVSLCVAGYAATAQSIVGGASSEAHHPPGLGETLALLRDRRLVLLLLTCAVHWGACAPFHLLFGVFARDMGLPSSVTGLAMFAAVGTEVVALLLFPRLETRFGLRALFGISFLGTAVRWLVLSRVRGAPAIVLIQVLHGLTFGTFWGASVAAMGQIVPARLRATGQALFSATVFGLGNAAGYWLSGVGYDAFGGVRPLYAGAGAIELLLFLTLYILPHHHEAYRVSGT